MLAAFCEDMTTIRAFIIAWPDLFQTLNENGQLPCEEYLSRGGKNRQIYSSLAPSYEMPWSLPSWYGQAGGWSAAKW